MPKTTPTVAEIVTFRLNDGTQTQDFVDAAAAIDPKLRATGQVVSRVLSCDDDGLWTDHIHWRSLSAAKSAAEQIMQDPDALPMLQMINPEGVSMRHATILYHAVHPQE